MVLAFVLLSEGHATVSWNKRNPTDSMQETRSVLNVCLVTNPPFPFLWCFFHSFLFRLGVWTRSSSTCCVFILVRAARRLAVSRHVRVQALPPAWPVFSCIPLESTCLLHRTRTQQKGFFFCASGVIWHGFTFRSVSVDGSKNCLEHIDHLEHSSCFVTVGGA